MQEVIRFVSVGLINTAVGYGVFLVALWGLGLSPALSNAIGYGIALAVAFGLYRNFVFKSEALLSGAVIRYAIAFAVAFGINQLVLIGLIRHFGLMAELSQIFAMVSYTMAFFALNKYFVFHAGEANAHDVSPSRIAVFLSSESVRLSIATVFAGLSFCFFVLRAPLRALHGGSDFAWNYLATRAWLDGINPYTVENALAQRGSGFPAEQDLGGIGSAYFPAVFPVTTPFSWMDWQNATVVFLIFNILLLAWVVRDFALRYLRDRSLATIVTFVGFSLLMYPTHTGIANLQHSIPAIGFAVLAMMRTTGDRRHMVEAAVFSALALAFKPQVGAVAVFYALVMWRWKLVVLMFAIYGALTLIGAFPIVFATGGWRWVDDLRHNIALISAQQSDIYCCVNLKPLLLHFVPAGLLSILSILPLALVPALIWHFRSRDIHEAPALETQLSIMAACGVSLLLSVYSRPYNLVLMLPVLVLVIYEMTNGTSRFMQWARVKHIYVLILASGLLVFVQPFPPLGLGVRKVGLSYLDWSDIFQKLWIFLAVPIQTYALLVILAGVTWRLSNVLRKSEVEAPLPRSSASSNDRES